MEFRRRQSAGSGVGHARGVSNRWWHRFRFLGLDNIGPFDRSKMLPGAISWNSRNGTAWMAKFCLNMMEMAARTRHPRQDAATPGYWARSAKSGLGQFLQISFAHA